ncbi:MAG: hypothetical protein ACI8W8_004318, partial [Rhodothermales bacterium]
MLRTNAIGKLGDARCQQSSKAKRAPIAVVERHFRYYLTLLVSRSLGLRRAEGSIDSRIAMMRVKAAIQPGGRDAASRRYTL